MTKSKFIWLCFLAVALFVAAVGIMSDIVINGMSLRIVASIGVWATVFRHWLKDFNRSRNKEQYDEDEDDDY